MSRYKVWFKCLAVVLSVLIGFQVAPVFAVALEQDKNTTSTTATTKLQKPRTSSAPKKTVSDDVLFSLADKDDETEEKAEKESAVLAEETEYRDASVKRFRLSEGRYLAAVYPEPVHYQRDGEWVEIDNILKETKAEDGTAVYGYDLAGRLTEEDGSNRV